MAKQDLPIQAFQDLLNLYVANWWFPWRHKIVKDENLDKFLVVENDSRITFIAHIADSEETKKHSYSVAELFSVESGLHDFVNWKTRGHAWNREWQLPIYDTGYGFQYMNMASMTIYQKMDYFLRVSDIT